MRKLTTNTISIVFLLGMFYAGLTTAVPTAHSEELNTARASSTVPVLMDQMIGSIDQTLTAYVSLTKKLTTFASKIGKKAAGSTDRKKLITQANAAVASFLVKEGKINKSFKTIDAQKGNSAILKLVSGHYLALHKRMLATKSKVSGRFAALSTATVRRAIAPGSVISRAGSTIDTAEADQCLNGLSKQYDNQLKQITDQVKTTTDPYAGWAVNTGFEETKSNILGLNKIQSTLKDVASPDVNNNFINKSNAAVDNYNSSVEIYNKLKKDHPVIAHSH